MDWTKCTNRDIQIIRYGTLWVLRKFGVMSWDEYFKLEDQMWRVRDGLD